MESGKDASVLESRTVRVRGNKCQPHERENINSSSSSPNNRFTTKDLESNQRERRKSRRINQEFSEDDKRSKRAKGSGSRRWEYSSVVRRKLNSSADSHPDIEGRTWNDNIIWVKGNCLQRDDEELLDLQFRSVKQSVKSTVEMKEYLLDEVAEEKTEIELVLGELGLSKKKRVECRSKSSAEPFDEQYAHKFPKRQIKKALPTSDTTVSGEAEQGKRRRVGPLGGSGEKVVEGRFVSGDDHKEVKERTGLAILQGKEDTNHLGYSQEEVDAIKADTYAEEEEEEAEVLGVVDGLDGVSSQTVLDSQRDDVELSKGGSEKVVKEMSLRINDLESGLVREIETSKALLSAQAELQVELDASRVREDHILMCNRKFAEQFDRMKEVNANQKDQYVKVHFRLEKLNQVISDLTRQVEEKESGIKRGLEDLSEETERAENLQRQVDTLAVKGKQADMAQYRIQALERTEELCRSDLNSCRIELERMRQKFIGKDDELRVAREILLPREEHVQRGNTDLRECQQKLGATLIRERILEGKIRAKDLLVKRNGDLLKDLPAREELNVKLGMLRARVVELQAMNLAESEQYIAKLKEDALRRDKIDADRNAWKDTYVSVKVRHERLKARFAKVVVPDVAQSDMLKVIVAYFVEEVKSLDSE
ncbi:hypothetical protein GIB67_019344 [Kingdonia uniflora]|uniref:Uncharacterized protein n=1 Tax=Kingdonia uniflora TaxID=39325 RepID=A0A7J7M1J0_9MAGN|nr:hypothetical protein GIB67_019344 [Kingdonia uniflora]